MTDETLAAEMKVTQGLVGQWKRGSTRISDASLVKLAARLNFDPLEVRPEISLDALLSGTPNSVKLAQLLRSVPRDEVERVSESLYQALKALKQKK